MVSVAHAFGIYCRRRGTRTLVGEGNQPRVHRDLPPAAASSGYHTTPTHSHPGHPQRYIIIVVPSRYIVAPVLSQNDLMDERVTCVRWMRSRTDFSVRAI